MKITSKRITAKYFELNKDFYVEVIDSYDEEGLKDIWFCRRNYAEKTYMLGVREKRITKENILGFIAWLDYGWLVNSLLDENEWLANDGHIVNVFNFEKTEVKPGETVRQAVERLFYGDEVEEFCNMLKCRNCINGCCAHCERTI